MDQETDLENKIEYLSALAGAYHDMAMIESMNKEAGLSISRFLRCMVRNFEINKMREESLKERPDIFDRLDKQLSRKRDSVSFNNLTGRKGNLVITDDS